MFHVKHKLVCYSAYKQSLFGMTEKAIKKPQHITTGTVGEALAQRYLEGLGYRTVDKNYRKRWGELDLVCERDKRVYFIEVKAVSYGTQNDFQQAYQTGTFRPELHVTPKKRRSLRRIIDTWCAERRYEGEIQVDIVAVYQVPLEKYAAVEIFPNIDLEN